MMDRPHLWIGQKWKPTFGHDSWDREVRVHWPDAIHEVVVRGAVWWHEGKVVAEMRNRRGWPPREAWVAKPGEQS